jgi:hypothetical protein
MRRQDDEERLALGFGELLGIDQVAQPLNWPGAVEQ